MNRESFNSVNLPDRIGVDRSYTLQLRLCIGVEPISTEYEAMRACCFPPMLPIRICRLFLTVSLFAVH